MAYCVFLRTRCYLVLWILLNVAIFVATYMKYQRPQYHYLYAMLGNGLCVSRASATIINLNTAIVLLPVCRGLNSLVYRTLNRVSRSLLTIWLANLTSVHITLAVTIVCAGVIHSIAHFMNSLNYSYHFDSLHPEINWAKYKGQSPLVLVLTSVVGLSGIGMLIILLMMLFLSLPYIRQSQYNLFWVTHFLFLPFLILLVIHPLSGVLKEQRNYSQHNRSCDNSSTPQDEACLTKPVFVSMECQGWIWVVVALSVFMVDFTVRLWRRNQSAYRVSQVTSLPCGVIRLTLTIQGVLVHKPAQYVLLQCPRLSSIEWHPFTVVSFSKSSRYTSITVLIRKRGDWTKALGKMFTNCGDHRILLQSQKHFRLLVDGSFCSPLENVLKSRIAVCIAAGIGITPFMAVLDHLNKSGCEKPSRMHLVWIVRTCDQLVWASDLITALHHKFWYANQPDRFEVSFFVTRSTTNKEVLLNHNFHNIIMQRIQNGRPEWTELFNEWAALYDKKDVSIFICGPQLLVTQIKTTSDKFNRRGFHFQCIQESFS